MPNLLPHQGIACRKNGKIFQGLPGIVLPVGWPLTGQAPRRGAGGLPPAGGPGWFWTARCV